MKSIRLFEKYQKEAVPAMIKKFGYTSVMAVPKIEKVVLNTGFGKRVTGKTSEEQKKISKGILDDLALIAGQAPVLTKAKKSIAGFKLRQGNPIGATVNLRGKRMYDFIERLINIALPRSRDFNGIPIKSIDQSGNLNLAIKEHIAFAEIEPERAKSIFGLEVTVVTSAKSKEEGLELLRLLGFPIKRE